LSEDFFVNGAQAHVEDDS